LAAAYFWLHLCERLVLVAIALWLLCGLGPLHCALWRDAERHRARARHCSQQFDASLQADIQRRCVDKLLEGDLLSASATSDDDTEAVIFEGIWSGTRRQLLPSGAMPERCDVAPRCHTACSISRQPKATLKDI